MSDLDRLFYWRGITADYNNYRGEPVQVPLENRVKLLVAMGVDVSTPEAIAAEAYSLDVEPWKHWLPSLVLSPAGSGAKFEINLEAGHLAETMKWRLLNVDGCQVQAGVLKGTDLLETGNYAFNTTHFSRRNVELAAMEPGYYTLTVEADERVESATLAACPLEVYQSQWSDDEEKLWGFIVQLYTLVSDENWGMGDFSDLKRLIGHAAQNGADLIGLNPLHALSSDLDNYFSPYSPSDRRFVNPLYIDVTNVPEYSKHIEAFSDKAPLCNLKDLDLVDYVGIRSLKYSAFQAMFENFIEPSAAASSERFSCFKSYVELADESLLAFAFYEACHQCWSGSKYTLSSESEYSVVKKNIFSDAEKNNNQALAILFHCYLQFVAEQQFEECQKFALSSGMKIGIVRDLAVGADGGGSEVNSNEALFCRQSAIGAPPDPLAQTGQNWGLPPMSPSELRASGFKHFIELLHTNMSHCGALRIDHAMSLMRLWWCPPAQSAAFGAYVYYPFDELLGILCLESYLNKCLIIGEDLGVVPDEFRYALHRTKIFTNKVFYFEKLGDQGFKRPEHYDSHALAMVNNHDVPTLVSWWNGTDLVLRDKLNLLEEGVDYQSICQERRRDKEYLFEMLSSLNLCPFAWENKSVDEVADESLIDAILVLNSRTASKLFVLQLEDLVMMEAPVNVPGTFHEHANWQRKLTTSISGIFANPRIKSILSKINSERKFNGSDIS
ncbi:MAG: 4-alpha-glucanotransferase [Lentisphaeria bacterium]|jgi:4-alpha-glucanotransferase